MIYKLLLLTIIAFFFAGISFQGQSQKKPVKTSLKAERILPIVDFDDPEQNSAELVRQRTKASRYDRKNSQPIEESSNVTSRVLNNHWSEGMSPLPVSESDVVLIGSVLSAKAYLSNDKTGVYSEFRVQADEVLKSEQSIQAGDTISVERYGGAVRFRSGYIQRYEVSGQGMPQLGQRYLFFLKRLDNEPSFKIMTGYALLGPTVMPLDGSIVEEGSQEYPFDKYQGLETSTLLQLVKTALTKNISSL